MCRQIPDAEERSGGQVLGPVLPGSLCGGVTVAIEPEPRLALSGRLGIKTLHIQVHLADVVADISAMTDYPGEQSRWPVSPPAADPRADYS